MPITEASSHRGAHNRESLWEHLSYRRSKEGSHLSIHSELPPLCPSLSIKSLPAHRDEEWPPLATTGESPSTETKTQHSDQIGRAHV